MTIQQDCAVCIIGAGPVGLSLALRLSDHGIASVLIDENPALKREGSKACLIQGDALEILDKSGCAAQIHAEGIAWKYSNVYIRGTRIAHSPYQLPNRYGPFVNISQYRIEQILLAEIERRPDIRVEWSTRVEALKQRGERVVVVALRSGETIRREFAYAVACNGQRSNLREATGVAWLGYRHSARFLITDIKAKLPLVKERHFHFDPPFNRGYQVIMHPQPDDVWRIDWQLPPDVDVKADRANGQLDRRIRSVIGDVPYTLEWISVYRFQQRIAERFVNGRVIFAGDAAHALPPYGSRGMNSGIQDADNLAWKLALVLQGHADPQLLATYHDERASAARENIAITEETIRFMVPSSPLVRWRRAGLFTLARRFPVFRKYVNSGKMAQPHRYVDSALVQPLAGAAIVGRFAPDAAIKLGGHREMKLREMLGRGFSFVYIGTSKPAVLPPVSLLQSSLGRLPTSALVIDTREGQPRSIPPGIVQGATADAEALADWQLNHWHLVRPDMHIAGVFDFQNPSEFGAALRDFSLARQSPPVPASIAA